MAGKRKTSRKSEESLASLEYTPTNSHTHSQDINDKRPTSVHTSEIKPYGQPASFRDRPSASHDSKNRQGKTLRRRSASSSTFRRNRHRFQRHTSTDRKVEGSHLSIDSSENSRAKNLEGTRLVNQDTRSHSSTSSHSRNRKRHRSNTKHSDSPSSSTGNFPPHHNNLSSESAPIIAENISVELGASASKRRRRDRQRSAVGPTEADHSHSKPSFSPGKKVPHQSSEVTPAHPGGGVRAPVADPNALASVGFSSTTGNTNNNMRSDGAAEPNHTLPENQPFCGGLLPPQYPVCAPSSLYLLPSSVSAPVNERHTTKRHSAAAAIGSVVADRSLHNAPHSMINDPTQRDNHLHHPPTINLTTHSDVSFPAVPFSGGSNPMSTSLIGTFLDSQPVNIAYLPNSNFPGHSTLPCSLTTQSFQNTIGRSLSSAVIPHDRRAAGASYQPGTLSDAAVLPMFTDPTVAASHSTAHAAAPSGDPSQAFVHSINVGRYVSLNPDPRASKMNTNQIAQSTSSSQSTYLPLQFFTKLSRHNAQNSGETDPNPGLGREVINWSISRSSTSYAGGRHSPHVSGINHRIAQLSQNKDDRSMQLVILQDINQILLMGSEENLINMNIHGLVSSVLNILECEEEHLIELKNLGCNVLTHMMDALPRSSEAVVPALPLLLTTMSSSFVGDILERIINLLEQLSKRHGREVLQSGGIAATLGFYDFVTLAQHKTILTMVSNCFAKLQHGDFELIVDCLPGLAERLKAAEPRCVELVSTCFVRLINTYRNEPEILKRIVSTCDLFTNLQHLLIASPPVLSSARDVIHMLGILCSSCPELAVDLVKKNISYTIYCILTGESIDFDQLQSNLLRPVESLSLAGATLDNEATTSRRHRRHSGSSRKRASSRHSRTDIGDDKTFSNAHGSTMSWPPLMITLSPLPDSSATLSMSVSKRTQEDVHAVVHLICELLPPISPLSTSNQSCAIDLEPRGSPTAQSSVAGSVASLVVNNKSVTNAGDRSSADTRVTPHRSASDRSSTTELSEARRRGGASLVHRLSIPLNHLVIDDNKLVFSNSSSSSGTLKRHVDFAEAHSDRDDPRVRLLREQCALLDKHMEKLPKSPSNQSSQRRSSNRRPSGERTLGSAPPENDVDSASLVLHANNTQALHTIQVLLPLLFDLYTESTQLQTRIRCLEAIQRMLGYSSPMLLAKTLRPRVVCNHIVGMLNSPERRLVLAGLQIALCLIDRIPPMFATYFRKEGILHQVCSLKTNLANSGAHSSLQCMPKQIDGDVHVYHSSAVSTSAHSRFELNDIQLLSNHVWTPSDSHQGALDIPQLTSSTPYVDRLRGKRESQFATSRKVSSTTVSAPHLMTTSLELMENNTNIPDISLSQWIENACSQLESRVAAVPSVTSSLTDPETTGHSSTAEGSVVEQYKLSPSLTTSAVALDLLPKLTTIASHLNANKPSLWVCAFSKLIELLRPADNTEATHVEPPSPFELQSSGVVDALLSYLTAADAQDVRLWIMFRMFFGPRATLNKWIPPAGNLLQQTKKQTSSKNFPHLLNMAPVLLNSSRLAHLRDVDTFLEQYSPSENLLTHGPLAFNALLECLLACLHRHEQFQVTSLPLMLPLDSPLLNFIQPEHSSSGVVTAGYADSSQNLVNNAETSSSQSTTTKHTSDNAVSRTTTRSRSHRSPATKLPSTKLSTPHRASRTDSFQSGELTLGRTHPLLRVSDTQLPPTPGFLCIEFVRLASSDEDAGCDSIHCSSNKSGVCSKNCRKSSSSSSSASSNLSATTGSASELLHSIPSRFPLQITAVATFQLVERLLLQRSYINGLLQDKPWGSDHDYALHSLPESFSLSPREFDLRDFHGGEESDNTDEVTIDLRRPYQTKKDSTSKRAYTRSHRNHANPSSSSHRPVPGWPDDSSTGSNPSKSKLRSSNIIVSEPDDAPLITSITYPLPNGLTEVTRLNSFIQEPHSQQAFSRCEFSNVDSAQRDLRSLLQPGTDESAVVESMRAVLESSGPSRTERASEPLNLRRRSIAKSNPSRDLTTPTGTSTDSGYFTNQHLSSIVSSLRGTPGVAKFSNNGSRGNPSGSKNRNVPADTHSVNPTDSTTRHPKSGSPTQASGSRHRRLRGSSILAAFGALGGLSSSAFNPQSSSHKQQPSKAHRGGQYSMNNHSSSNSRRAYAPGSASFPSMSPSSFSNSSSSMSPVSTENGSLFRGKCRTLLQFYVDGHQLPSNLPLFEAIVKYSSEFKRRLSAVQQNHLQRTSSDAADQPMLTGRELEELTGHLMWSMTHTVHYRLVTLPLHNDSVGSTSNSPGTVLNPKSGHAPSPPSTSTFSSAITCLKRRRSDDPESPSDIATVKPNSVSSTMDITKESSGSKHPLLARLACGLPKGLLEESRCLCDASKGGCSATLSSNNEVVQPNHGIFGMSTSDRPIMTTLCLLRALHTISRSWYTLYDSLDPYPILSPAVFRSPKLSVKANRQLQDLFTVLAGNIPSWLTQLISTCPFLFPFDVRRTFFYAYDFDRDRTLLRFQDANISVSDMEQQVVAGHRSTSNLAPNQDTLFSNSFPQPVARSNHNTEISSTINALGPVNLSTPYLSLLAPEFAQTMSTFSLPLRTESTRYANIRSRYYTRLALSPSIKRHKVTVHREGKRLLRQAEATLTELSDSRAVLEIAFDGEVGFGLGPTLEFYTLVSRELMKSSLNLWHGSETTKDGYIIAPPPGLYPRPLSKQARSTVIREVRSKFVFLGRLMARALLDWRQLDLPFSAAFFKWFLSPNSTEAISDGHILPNDLALVDPELARHLRQLADMAERRQTLLEQHNQQMNNESYPGGASHLKAASDSAHKNGVSSRGFQQSRGTDELKASLLLLDNEIEDLCLNFVLPGYDIELLKNGSHIMVTGSNLGDYIRLVAHWLLIEGVHRQMESVIEGFDSVLPKVRQRLALLFQPDEMEGLFCGRSVSQFETLWASDSVTKSKTGEKDLVASNEWDVQSLSEACRCDHGYTLQSRTIRNLFEVMAEFNEVERRLFLQFVTGSPRLPVGGFRALKPPLKIVLKRESGENADSHLPSVMTCQNYLKLPDYSSKEILACKLRYAICEGQNAFHLS